MPSTPPCPQKACTRSSRGGTTAPLLLLVWSALLAQKHRWFDDVQYTRRQSGFSRLDFFLPGVLEVLPSLYIPRSQPPPSVPCWRPTYQTRTDTSLLSSDLINKKATPLSPPIPSSRFQLQFLSPISSTSHEISRPVAFLASLPVFLFPSLTCFCGSPKGRAIQRSLLGGQKMMF